MTTLTDRVRTAWRVLTAPVSDVDRLTAKAAGTRKVSAIKLWSDYRNETPLWSLTDIQSYIDYGFSLNAVIYAACMYRADAVNSAQLRAYMGTPDDMTPKPMSDPLARLLQRPNRFQSAYEFQALNSVFFAIAGQSFTWFKRQKVGAVPVEMYSLRPDWVYIVPSNDNGEGVIGYVYAPEGTSIASGYPLLPEDIMHVKKPNPSDPLLGAGYGFSPLGPAAQSANVDNDVTRFLKIFFQSGAMFQNAVSFEGSHSPEELATVREKLKDIYGGVDNWNEWGVFDSSAKIQRVSPTFEEMGFESIDDRNEARLLMTLGVPPILVGSRLGLNRSTYSNYEEARRAFWEDRLLPELRMFENEYQNFLGDDQTIIKYDLSSVPALRRDIPALAKAAKDLVDMGTPPRLAYVTVGLDVPAYDGDMERYINLGGGSVMTPAAVTVNAEQATDAVVAGEKRLIKSYDPLAMGLKVDAIARSWEQRYGDKAVEVFETELNTLLAMLNETQKAAYAQKATPNWSALEIVIEDWYKINQPEEWRAAFVPLIQETMIESGKEWSSTLGVAFDVRNLEAESWFQSYMLKFAQPITDTSSQSVKDIIAQAMAEGGTIPETEKRLELLFQQWMKGDLSPDDFTWFEQRLPQFRREAIARTESIRAASQGTLELGKSWGAKKKFWIASFDDRTRESHLIAGRVYDEKGAIAIDEVFNVGGTSMNAPGDPAAPPEEVVNCRCTPGLLMD